MKFILENITPTGSGAGIFTPNALEDFLSKAKENNQRFMCYDDKLLSGLNCDACASNTFMQMFNVQQSKVKDRNKGNFLHSFTCISQMPPPNNTPVVCQFQGNSGCSERIGGDGDEPQTDENGKLTKITLVRTEYDGVNRQTKGFIQIGTRKFYTLEPQFGNIDETIKSVNGVDITLRDYGSLPSGKYHLEYLNVYENNFDHTFYRAWRVVDKRGSNKVLAGTRDEIYIHSRSNHRGNTKGCIIISDKFAFNFEHAGIVWSYIVYRCPDEKIDVMDFLFQHLSQKECILEVREVYK